MVHAWILKLLSPKTLIHQSPTIFKFNYRGGAVRLERVSEDTASISIWADGMFPEWYTHSVPHWLGRALELTGGGASAVTHRAPDAGFRHTYDLAWEC